LKNIIATESEEQKALCQYLNLMGVVYYAIPNGTYLSGTIMQRAKQMNRLKAEGLKTGVPDLCLLFKEGKSVYIELKRRSGGTVSKDQKEWKERLQTLGFDAHIAKGAAEAIKIVEKYLP
jgi:hypothetical protein